MRTSKATASALAVMLAAYCPPPRPVDYDAECARIGGEGFTHTAVEDLEGGQYDRQPGKKLTIFCSKSS